MTRSLYFMMTLAVAMVARASDWELVWSDEFDRPGAPDPAKWGHEVGFIRNEELQYYTRGRAENARVEGGSLVIEARREAFPNPAFDASAGGKDWKRARREATHTSASLTTKGKASWRYGRIEVRAQLPEGRGMWPAIWMLGDVGPGGAGWPACGEIDIMEYVGHEPGIVHGTVHTAKYNHTKKTQRGARLEVGPVGKKFRVYAIEWDQQKIDFFVDKKRYFTFANEGAGEEAWPFDKAFYLILNVAVGGAWGGAKGVDDAAFPAKMLVDYVRVYERR
ncbi:MAG: glycoside hydrolase family 16 protein [Verrucomicrobiae bacterium]|nr:glycoside hydrolase family 16 protein [Verrucomicrobiae bacterium]